MNNERYSVSISAVAVIMGVHDIICIMGCTR